MKSNLLTVYARYEPSRDEFCRRHMQPEAFAQKRDVVVYRDAACTQAFARFGPGQPRPRRNTRQVLRNYYLAQA